MGVNGALTGKVKSAADNKTVLTLRYNVRGFVVGQVCNGGSPRSSFQFPMNR